MSCAVCNLHRNTIIYTNKKRQTVTFTDKKEFNLNGPDSLRRSMGGDGVMIWVAIGY